METESDVKSQKVMGKFPGIVLIKFNIHHLSHRLATITRWAIDNASTELKDLPIGYFGASNGSAASIEAVAETHILNNIRQLI